MNICRYCNKPIDNNAVKTLSYWGKLPFVCHAECRVKGEQDEAISCQTIDADCNDCKHYQRGQISPSLISKVKTQDGRIEDVIFKPEIFINGFCRRFNKPTVAQPNKCTLMQCFEHRKS